MSRPQNVADQCSHRITVNVALAAQAISLCAPGSDLSCFGCCPPIRPPHYDPLDYTGFLKREFAENRRQFLEKGPCNRPIAGFSCWALGLLDSQGHRIGCLLHPQQNFGEDLRHLVGYDVKCRRESCRPARVFAQLSASAQAFWLELAGGLNSFYFSSRRANPLFHILEWGEKVLNHLHREASINDWTMTELLSRRRFVTDRRWKPKAHRWLFGLALDREPPGRSMERPVERMCQQLLDEALAAAKLRAPAPPDAELIFSHLLPMPEAFKDFIRLGLGCKKTTFEHARQIDLQLRSLLEKMDASEEAR